MSSFINLDNPLSDYITQLFKDKLKYISKFIFKEPEKSQIENNTDDEIDHETFVNTEKNKTIMPSATNVKIYDKTKPETFWDFEYIHKKDKIIDAKTFKKHAGNKRFITVEYHESDNFTNLYFTDIDRSLRKFYNAMNTFHEIEISDVGHIEIIGCGAFRAQHKNITIGKTKFISDDPELLEKKLKQNGNFIRFLSQTEYLCELAVMHNGLAVRFVIKQTDNICKLAVIHNGLALQYVENKTPEICVLAVQENEKAIKFVPDEMQTIEMCKICVERDGNMLMYVTDANKTEEICQIAIAQNQYATEYAIVKYPQ